MITCTRLSISHLWVDALCILQDDADDADWTEQSAEMHMIYSNAYLVLAADSALDCASGFLFQAMRENSMGYKVEDLRNNSWNVRRVPVREGNKSSFLLKHTLLSHRAWTLQETLLPPRIAHFTGTEIVLRIDEHFYCQCGRCTHFAYVGTEKQDWYAIVSLYSFRDLSHPEDKLPALSGLASRVARPGDVYLAGLWQKTLERDLLWYVSGVSGVHRRSMPWIAPTWSWASMDGGIEYFSGYANYIFEKDLRIWKAECELASTSAFGQVSSGLIDLTGSVVPVNLVVLTERFPNYDDEYNGQHGKASRVHETTCLIHGEETSVFEVLCDQSMMPTPGVNEDERALWLSGKPGDPQVSHGPYFCLYVGRYMERIFDMDDFRGGKRSFREWFLLLKRYDDGNDVFERVGVGYKSSRNFESACDLFNAAERRRIRLI